LDALSPAARDVSISGVVTGAEARAVVVLVRVSRPVGAIEPLIAFAVIAMTDGIVAAAILAIVLRVPEPVGVAARERRLLVAARKARRRSAQPADAAATPLRVRGKRGREKSQRNEN